MKSFKIKKIIDEKRAITPRWVMGFTSKLWNFFVDLDMLHIFAI
jgi:hypothetical protein